MIKAVIFDFVGVVLVPRKNNKPDPLIDIIDSKIGKVVDDQKFIKETIKKFGMNEEKFFEVMEKVVNKYVTFKPLWDILPTLRQKYKLAIINNGTRMTLPEFSKKFGYNKYFDLFISSAKEGIRKPDKRIYLLTAKKLGVEPAECLFMDDSIENIEGAERVGMQTIWWKDSIDGLRKFKEFI